MSHATRVSPFASFTLPNPKSVTHLINEWMILTALALSYSSLHSYVIIFTSAFPQIRDTRETITIIHLTCDALSKLRSLKILRSRLRDFRSRVIYFYISTRKASSFNSSKNERAEIPPEESSRLLRCWLSSEIQNVGWRCLDFFHPTSKDWPAINCTSCCTRCNCKPS